MIKKDMNRKKRYGKCIEHRKVAVTKTSLDVLEAVFSQELVRTNHLYGLLPHRHPSGLLNTLRILHEAGLLEKVGDRPSKLTTAINIYDPDIYLLTDEGERFLMNRRTPVRYVNTYRPRGDYRIEHLHKLGISDSIANIRNGARATPCTIVGEGAIKQISGLDPHLPLKLPVTVRSNLSGVWRSWSGDLTPDGLFAIQYEDGRQSFVALEYQNTGAVRANTFLGTSSMRRKYLGYVDAYYNKSFQRHWNIPNLRVLCIFAQDDDYRASLKLGAELFPEGNPMFLHIHLPKYHETSSGFLLAPKPFPGLFSAPLTRIGKEPVALYDATEDPSKFQFRKQGLPALMGT